MNELNRMTVNSALEKSYEASRGIRDHALIAFYWLAVIVVKCLIKLAYPKND